MLTFNTNFFCLAFSNQYNVLNTYYPTNRVFNVFFEHLLAGFTTFLTNLFFFLLLWKHIIHRIYRNFSFSFVLGVTTIFFSRINNMFYVYRTHSNVFSTSPEIIVPLIQQINNTTQWLSLHGPTRCYIRLRATLTTANLVTKLG